MKQIECVGTPREIGIKHGESARAEISRSLDFYADLFLKTAGLSWPEVCDIASKFDDMLQREWPRFFEEMQGVAQGARVPYTSILALNVRTEIAYGMSKDGCTALYLRDSNSTFLSQNWDWQEEQQENLINLHITLPSKVAINMITEAGIIGKIGLNSNGVGVCLNAIRAPGVDFERLPCHLALRSCLESEPAAQAVAMLHRSGVASACHILVGDEREAVGLECTSVDIVELPTKDVLTHTNHSIETHHGVEDKMALKDSPARLERINQLVRSEIAGDDKAMTRAETIRKLLADEDGFPTSICRAKTADSSVATLFSIIMDLKGRTAEVCLGRPCREDVERLHLAPRMFL